MKSLYFTSLFFLFLFASCNNGASKTEEPAASENEDDAARNFIRSVLDQDFDKARTLIVNDSLNNEYINITERAFKERMSKEEKNKYRSANIQNYTSRSLNDSTIVVYYENSYKKQSDSLLLVKRSNQWLVDLKYSFPASKVGDAQ